MSNRLLAIFLFLNYSFYVSYLRHSFRKYVSKYRSFLTLKTFLRAHKYKVNPVVNKKGFPTNELALNPLDIQ